MQITSKKTEKSLSLYSYSSDSKEELGKIYIIILCKLQNKK